MLFCPICANCILIENSVESYRFICNTCNYYFPIKNKIKNSLVLKNK